MAEIQKQHAPRSGCHSSASGIRSMRSQKRKPNPCEISLYLEGGFCSANTSPQRISIHLTESAQLTPKQLRLSPVQLFMTKSTGTLLLLWILTAAAATYFWHHSSRRKVRETELQQKISQLEKDLETTRAQTQKIQDPSELKALKTELMRLRAELTQRRDVSTRLEALQLENE